MSNRNSVVLLGLVLCLPLSYASPARADDRPNVVMIFADDLGFGDLACYGHPYAVTANIDRLAREGTRFTRYYATGVTCCPSRTGFMTSRHPAGYENYPAAFGFGDRITVTELLHDNGYVTGHFGKWHIGPEKRGLSEGVYGLDEVKIIGNSESPETGRDDDLFNAAIDFIKRHRDEPFYVNIWGHITHYPVKPSDDLDQSLADLQVDESRFDSYMKQKFANTKKWSFDVDHCMRNYLADVRSLDLAIGRVLSVLDQCGLTKKTIVVFSSDQGPAPNGEFQNDRQRELNPVYKANMLGWAGGLRGGKHEQYEGGVRIPFILRWPGRVPANRVNSTSVLSGLDWLPTLCSLTSTPYEESGDFEGLNVADIWLGGDRNFDRYLFWKAGRNPSALSHPWKIHLTNDGSELYNLDDDPGETTNVVARYPDIAQRMIDEIATWTETLPAQVNRKARRAE